MLEAQFQALRDALNDTLVERKDEVELLLLGILSGEHVLFVGPPGTAKSLVCNELTKGISGSNIFHILLNKYTDPSETAGPLNVPRLKEGHYERLITGYLPTAHFAFVDEIWKASSSIQNTLLTMIEERKFQNDGKWISCPLQMLIGASNEWPLGEGFQEAGAMFDRFLLRKQVKPVSPMSRRKLFFQDLPGITKAYLTLGEINAAFHAAQALPVPVETEDAYLQIIGDLGREGILPGDRRARKAVKVAKAAAWLDGASEVRVEHLEVLKHVLWEDPRDQVSKCAEIVARIANPMGHEVNTILAEADEALIKINMDDIASVSSGVKKAKHSMDRLQKLVLSGGGKRCADAITYIQTRCNEIQAKLMGLTK